jgi:hypothetical protein
LLHTSIYIKASLDSKRWLPRNLRAIDIGEFSAMCLTGSTIDKLDQHLCSDVGLDPRLILEVCQHTRLVHLTIRLCYVGREVNGGKVAGLRSLHMSVVMIPGARGKQTEYIHSLRTTKYR